MVSAPRFFDISDEFFEIPEKEEKEIILNISEKENAENRGSVEFQVFTFTTKIRRLTSHLELHKKDSSSQRGLRKILGKRQRLLAYLLKKNRGRYKKLISELNIREIKTR